MIYHQFFSALRYKNSLACVKKMQTKCN
jgi:hypothetical protein